MLYITLHVPLDGLLGPLLCIQDMRENGSTLAEILQAGQWHSAAFATYMNGMALEKVLCLT